MQSAFQSTDVKELPNAVQMETQLHKRKRVRAVEMMEMTMAIMKIMAIVETITMKRVRAVEILKGNVVQIMIKALTRITNMAEKV